MLLVNGHLHRFFIYGVISIYISDMEGISIDKGMSTDNVMVYTKNVSISSQM